MIPHKDVGPFEVCFSYIKDSGQSYTWSIDRLHKWLETHPQPLHSVPLFRADAEMVLKDNGVEPDRLAAISAEDIDRYPILFVGWKSGTHTLLDGNHRFVKAFTLGHRTITAHIIPERILRPFQIAPPKGMTMTTVPRVSGLKPGGSV